MKEYENELAEEKKRKERKADIEDFMARRKEEAEAAVLRSMEAYEDACEQDINDKDFEEEMSKKFGLRVDSSKR